MYRIDQREEVMTTKGQFRKG